MIDRLYLPLLPKQVNFSSSTCTFVWFPQTVNNDAPKIIHVPKCKCTYSKWDFKRKSQDSPRSSVKYTNFISNSQTVENGGTMLQYIYMYASTFLCVFMDVKKLLVHEHLLYINAILLKEFFLHLTLLYINQRQSSGFN